MTLEEPMDGETIRRLADVACDAVLRGEREAKRCEWVFADTTPGRVVAELARRLVAERRRPANPDIVVDG